MIRESQKLVFYCENRSGFSNQKFKHIEQKVTSDMELGPSQKQKVSASCKLLSWNLGEKYKEDRRQWDFFSCVFHITYVSPH